MEPPDQCRATRMRFIVTLFIALVVLTALQPWLPSSMAIRA